MSLLRPREPRGFDLGPIYDDARSRRTQRLIQIAEGKFDGNDPTADFGEQWSKATANLRCRRGRIPARMIAWLLVVMLCVAAILYF